MSELCLSSTSRTRLFFSLLKSDLFLFCSFILSHPIYFFYFIFFSPYLLKLLSFLSPLFATTSLLLLALLTVSPSLIEDNFSKQSSACSKVSFLITAYHAVVENLRSKIDDHNEEFLCLEDFEVFKIVFDTPPMIHDAKGSQVEVLDPAISLEAPEATVFACSNEALAGRLEVENSGDSGAELQAKWAAMEEKRLDCFLEQVDEFDESMITTSVEEKKIEPPGTKANKAVEKQEEKSLVKNGSEAAGSRKSQNTVEFGSGKVRQTTARVKGHSQRVAHDANVDSEENGLKVESSRALDYINLGSYGSMRKEKDWKRTLACKLFEERHKADGGEGMDLLWETYETESSKTKPKGDLKKKNKKKYEVKYRVEEEEDDQDDGEDESDGQLCCLQALKFSAGKMNLGMGRPSLVRISKAIKGIGWLHNVGRHSKKVHNGDRF